MAEVVWSDKAIAQLDEATAYIRQFDPRAADRIKLKLFKAARLLSITPEMGRRISKGRRQIASVRPYLLRYRFNGEVVRIIEIRHGARRPN